MNKTKSQKRITRHKRVRARISGTAECPRVAVFKSNRHIFVQVIDDARHKTLMSSKIVVGAKTKVKPVRPGGRLGGGTKTEKATAIGAMLAEKIQALGIKKVLFDRGGFKYHGRVKAVADGLRNGGIMV